ncbi:hypothetical protein B0J13DRAFT_228997 [Dactylonectria estremocensis]|uniref:BTB domain-containing protein n=1 Tax=Dactylonectria estremocensis TaxID=1079267 RepID=A0A9P9F7C9_9HYPO|nr:hypothetical protein B0J13DRAFT_228997 [Dactylonectria estremocensis]
MALVEEERLSAPPSKHLDDIPSGPASPPSESPPQPITIDGGGDLVLRVGAEADGCEQEFFVCSNTMRRSSPVWKRMLYGGFKEARPTEGPWVVTLPDDRATPMLTILNIIHTRFALVPREPALSEVYHILTLAHKYDMTEVLQPWADCWMEVADNAQEKEDGCSLAMLTYVAWEMGNEDLFATMVNKLLLGSSVDDQGRLNTPDGICLENYDYLGPPDLLEMISEFRRNDLIQPMLDVVHALIKDLLGFQVCCKKELQKCDYSILGSVWYGMTKFRGSVMPESADEILESVTELASSVCQVSSYMSCLDNHTKCNPREKIEKIVRKTVRSRKFILGPSHIEYMRKQRLKTGVAPPFVWDPCWVKNDD